MAVIAIGGDDLIPLLACHLHAGDHGLLADIEVAEAADLPHAVELPSLLLETADEQHLAVGIELLLRGQARRAAVLQHCRRGECFGRDDGRCAGWFLQFFGAVLRRSQNLAPRIPRPV